VNENSPDRIPNPDHPENQERQPIKDLELSSDDTKWILYVKGQRYGLTTDEFMGIFSNMVSQINIEIINNGNPRTEQG